MTSVRKSNYFTKVMNTEDLIPITQRHIHHWYIFGYSNWFNQGAINIHEMSQNLLVPCCVSSQKAINLTT